MSVMSERDVLHEGLRELANELDAIEALIPEDLKDLEEVSLRLQKGAGRYRPDARSGERPSVAPPVRPRLSIRGLTSRS